MSADTMARARLSRPASAGEEDLVRAYLKEIGTYPLLTKDDEQRLGRLVDDGRKASEALAATPGDLAEADREALVERVRAGRRAAEEFVQANLRLVVSIAKRYQSAGLSLLDLVQEGNLGLMHAVEKFDFRRNLKFSTYATWWIRQAVTRAIANGGRTIRLPVHAGETVARVQKAQALVEAERGRPPTLCELAAEVGLTEEKVVEALNLIPHPISISEPRGSEGEGELGEIIEDPGPTPVDEVIAASVPVQVAQLLGGLDDRERRIICLRYGLDCGTARTLVDVAGIEDLTPEGVRNIERRALTKLRLRTVRTRAADILAG